MPARNDRWMSGPHLSAARAYSSQLFHLQPALSRRRVCPEQLPPLLSPGSCHACARWTPLSSATIIGFYFRCI